MSELFVDAEASATGHEEHEKTTGDGKILVEKDEFQGLRDMADARTGGMRAEGNHHENQRKQRPITRADTENQRDDDDPFGHMRDVAHDGGRGIVEGLPIKYGSEQHASDEKQCVGHPDCDAVCIRKIRM